MKSGEFRIMALGAAVLLLATAVRTAAEDNGLQTNRPAGASAPHPPAERHTVWRIQGAHATVYLLGSIHVLQSEDYPLPGVIERAFTGCKIAMFETDLRALDEPANQQKLLAKSLLPPGTSLAREVSPETYARLNREVRQNGLPPGILDRMRPPIAAITLEALVFQALGFTPDYGVDRHFFKRARLEDKRIITLESADFQMGLVTSLSQPEGELWLKTTLDEIEQNSLQRLVTAWKAGDSAALENILTQAQKTAPDLYQRLVSERNRRWLPAVERLLRGDQDAMVIIGAGHLVGPEGLVSLLRQKGWKVQQQ